MPDSPSEFTVATAEQALLARLRDAVEYDAYETGEDWDAAGEQFERNAPMAAVQTIGGDVALRNLALAGSVIHLEHERDGSLVFWFENGARNLDGGWMCDVDFPLGAVMAIHGGFVASCLADPDGLGDHLAAWYSKRIDRRRRERSLFAGEAEVRRAAGECALAWVLNQMADACSEDADKLEPDAHDWRRWEQSQAAERLVAGKISACRRAPSLGRRRDRRMGCGRPRVRAIVRASSRGGDSGDTSDDPEPAGPGDPVGDTSRVLSLLLDRGRA